MKKTDIKEIYDNPALFANKEVTIGGWVRSARDLKSFGFIDLNDGSCFKGAQIVLNIDKLKNYNDVANLNTGSSIICRGQIILTPENKQPFEIIASEVQIVSATDETYPIQKKRQSVEFLREYAYLRSRTNLFNAAYRVRSKTSFAIHEFFNKNNFVYMHTPIITSADCEGGSDVFRVTTHSLYDKKSMATATPDTDFFGKNVFLTPTGQLEAEAFALAFGKVYTFGPTFRAENSNTARHASEFWMMEPEMAFCDLDGDMEIIQALIKYVINYLFENCKTELEFFDQFVEKGLLDKLHNLTGNEFAHITYTEAIKLLEKNNDKFEYKIKWGADLQSEHERFLCEQIFKRPVFVTDYPKEIKAFYMYLNDDGKTVRACDLLVPGIGELIGGSQREDRETVLLQKIKECNLKPEDYDWYIKLRKYGGVPHSGFGLGFDRLLMYVTGISNIRDSQPCPRTPKNCNF